jgi:5-hydroxyisourate hydrolase
MAGMLTTHVLDIMHGCPAATMQIQLRRFDHVHEQWQMLKTVYTMYDGRTQSPLLQDKEFTIGRYELTFMVNSYFTARGILLAEPAFLDDIPIRFAIANVDEHYHVPLLVSPWAYSTYRGS